jgi:manganese oxidase
LHGALIVLEPDQPRDTTTDRIMLLDAGGPKLDAAPLVNGSGTPPPLDLQTGVTYRLRLINITADDVKRVALVADTTAEQWRAVGKDGADLPAAQTIPRPARVLMGPGETCDFEFTPRGAGDLALEITTFRTRQKPSVMRVPVRVH